MSHSASAGSDSSTSRQSAPGDHPIAAELDKWRALYCSVTPRMTEDMFDFTVDDATRKQRQQAFLDAAEAASKDVIRDYMKWCEDHKEELDAWSRTWAFRQEDVDPADYYYRYH